MKVSPWILMSITTVLLSACGNADDRRTLSPDAIAAKNVAEIQVAMDQANTALKAVEAADTDKQEALKLAKDRRDAVKISIARLAKQSDMLKQDAENKARWASLMQERAIETRKALLLAALEQSKTEELVVEKTKAVQKARVQAEIHQDIANRAKQEKITAERLAANIIEARDLAALSLSPHEPEAATQKMVATKTAPASASKHIQALSPKIAPEHKKLAAAKNLTATAMTKSAYKKFVKASHREATADKNAAEIKLASAPAMPAVDPVRGHGLAQKCQLCHSFEPNQKAKFGPELFGIVGQQAGKSQNYKYGSALSKADFTWNETTLTEWICNSGKTIKKLTGDKSARTKMPNQNTCGQNARDIVAYLSTLKTQASNPAQTDNL